MVSLPLPTSDRTGLMQARTALLVKEVTHSLHHSPTLNKVCVPVSVDSMSE